MLQMHATLTAPPLEREPVGSTGLEDVARSTGRDRTLAQRVASVAGAVGVALLVPVVILLIGLPVVLVVRLLVEAVTWILAALL